MRQDEADASGDDDTRCWRDGMYVYGLDHVAAPRPPRNVRQESLDKTVVSSVQTSIRVREPGGFHSSLKKIRV